MTPSNDSREARRAATEVKFLLDPEQADRVRAWARAHLDPDPHGAGPFGDTYTATTLYTDTPGFDVFHRRGSQGRAKFRLRRYEHAPEVFLERKLRRPGLLVKWRTPVPAGALADLGSGALGAGAPGFWFQRRVSSRGLAPTCCVRYRRLARAGAAEGGTVRLTLDDRLEAWTHRGYALENDGPAVAVADDGQILELKYRGRLPALFRRLVEDLAISPIRMSKYRLAATALGLAAGPDADLGTEDEPDRARYA